MRFLTADEMAGIAQTLKFLNENLSAHETRLDSKVLDSNGDVVGRIGFSESGYVFYLDAE